MKKMNLTIPEPCHENWDRMEKEEKGKFCNACQKTVVDFTNMSDKQIAEFFKRPASSVCGRFQQDQLNRDLSIPRKRLPWLKYFLQITLPAFLISAKANAQGRVKVISDTTIQSCEKTVINEERKELTKDIIVIKGKISDENGNPIAFASVVIKGTNQGVAADAEGAFIFKVKQGSVLEISAIGMMTKEIIADNNLSKNIVLINMETMIMGDIVITKKKPIKTNPLITKFFDSAFIRFSVYPSPVRSGQQITIETKKLEAGEYLLELVQLNGQIIQSTEITIDKKHTSFKETLITTSAGIYFVRLTNKKTGRAYSEKLMVE